MQEQLFVPSLVDESLRLLHNERAAH